MIETILVATDGSEAASSAERCGIALALKLRARLSGITVVEDCDVNAPTGDDLNIQGFPALELAAYHKARAEAISSRFAQRVTGEGLSASCEIAQGVPCDRIVERGQAMGMTVVGRDGRGGRGVLLGSTIDGVVRKSAKPTLVVPAGAPISGPILLGFDGSPGSRIAANLAVQLANGLGEAVHVFVDSKDKGRAVARFDEVRQLVGGLSVPVRENSSTLGRPDVKLVDTAREIRAGIIAIGAFGRNRISEYFLGSNAMSVVRSSPVAVLLAR